MLPRLLTDLYTALFGLVVGSFLNVVIYRLPRGRSMILPRSACPHCGAPIGIRDNLPLVSFALLRGRCRSCRGRISWRYPAVEGATAALFVACVERFGVSPAAASSALLGSLLLALAVIDLEHLLLPDQLTLPGIGAGLLLQPWLPQAGFFEALNGAFLGAGIVFLVAEAWSWLRDAEGMGMGDAKMLALVGAFLGWKGVLVTLFLAALAGGLTGLGFIAARRMDFQSRLPFGAFLALGGLIALFFGEALADAYLGLLLL